MATSTRVERKLTTILAADAAGYSSAMDADEVGTLEALRASREIFSKFIERHNGRIVNTAGDGLVAEFPSVVEAVQCAIEVQRELGGSDQPSNGKLRFRIGVHLGDVMVDGDDLLGEGVNLAARLQSMAEPGGVLISRQVYDQVHSKISVGFEYLGERRPKNFSEDVAVYGISFGEEKAKPFFGRHGSSQEAESSKTQRQKKRTSAAETAGMGSGHDAANDGSIADWNGFTRNAKIFGVILAALAIINIVTSSAMWVQWPAVAMYMILGWQAAPFFAAGRFDTRYARLMVIIGGLFLINLFSWSGTAWVLWPAGALLVVEVIRRIRAAA